MIQEGKNIRIGVVSATNVERYDFVEQLKGGLKSRIDGATFDLFEIGDVDEVVEHRLDVVVQLADAMDLEESLVTTPRLIDMHQKVVIAMTRYAALEATGHQLDFGKLGMLMGLQVGPVEISRGEGIDALAEMVKGVVENKENATRHLHVPYGPDVEASICAIKDEVDKIPGITEKYSRRDLSLRLLEHPETTIVSLVSAPNLLQLASVVEKARHSITSNYHQAPEEVIHLARHGFVHGALEQTLHHGSDNSDHTTLEKVDQILTNKYVGFPILVLVLYLVFECTFSLGSYPQDWIAGGVDWLCKVLSGVLPVGWLSSMLIDGVVQGVGAVLSFLPNIIILFFFISLMEDSGYMARAAFLMDGIMHKVGLHGNSFIPMLVGFGCNVPAIMAARNIENKKDRTLTMLMIPFMSCSARLPVYMLLVSAFFVKYQALVMISLYLAGILLSILFALVMKHTKYFRKPDEDYVMGLPAFRRPTMRATLSHIWERCEDYLKKISSVILIASIVIWALYYFPRNEHLTAPYETQLAQLERQRDNATMIDDRTMIQEQIDRCTMEMESVQKNHSLLASIGRWIEPVMRPIGFDWKMNVCVLTGLPAKEAIVSTMGILYHSGENEKLSVTLRESKVFTPASALAFMMFVLLYFPCIATVATLKREIGRGWAAFTVVHSMALAWVVAFLTFQIGSLF